MTFRRLGDGMSVALSLNRASDDPGLGGARDQFTVEQSKRL